MSTELKNPVYLEGLRDLRISLINMLPKESIDIIDRDAEFLAQMYNPNVLAVKARDRAPEFSLVNAIGEMISLKELIYRQRMDANELLSQVKLISYENV